MKIDTRALAITVALLWGGCVLGVGLLQTQWPDYGKGFLDGVASVYPGFEAGGTYGDAAIGGLYALADGFLAGLILGWLYNLLRRKETAAEAH